MQDSTSLAFEQTMVASHQAWMATNNRAIAGDTNVAEQTRIGFLIDRANMALAGDILAQRAAQQQPQVGVIPAVATVAKA